MSEQSPIVGMRDIHGKWIMVDRNIKNQWAHHRDKMSYHHEAAYDTRKRLSLGDAILHVHDWHMNQINYHRAMRHMLGNTYDHY